jgi:hypothetical protein
LDGDPLLSSIATRRMTTFVERKPLAPEQVNEHNFLPRRSGVLEQSSAWVIPLAAPQEGRPRRVPTAGAPGCGGSRDSSQPGDLAAGAPLRPQMPHSPPALPRPDGLRQPATADRVTDAVEAHQSPRTHTSWGRRALILTSGSPSSFTTRFHGCRTFDSGPPQRRRQECRRSLHLDRRELPDSSRERRAPDRAVQGRQRTQAERAHLVPIVSTYTWPQPTYACNRPTLCSRRRCEVRTSSQPPLMSAAPAITRAPRSAPVKASSESDICDGSPGMLPRDGLPGMVPPPGRSVNA